MYIYIWFNADGTGRKWNSPSGKNVRSLVSWAVRVSIYYISSTWGATILYLTGAFYAGNFREWSQSSLVIIIPATPIPIPYVKRTSKLIDHRNLPALKKKHHQKTRNYLRTTWDVGIVWTFREKAWTLSDQSSIGWLTGEMVGIQPTSTNYSQEIWLDIMGYGGKSGYH